ncbi:MAG TPA: ATP-binding cassette domain-containing protein [Bryobacteraceae bacterium]|jgi:sodium transport system ATP-binding protein|nr:ATP-binding cassette domain-containing protein [Bryobacteraceae bacterium]
MIQAHNLQKRFGAVQAVRDLSFSASDGKITGLLGSNGAGKTTTLRMICGVLQPDHGTVRIDKPVGALLDHIGLYPRLTTRENLAYFGELRGIPRARLAQRIDQVLSQFGMEHIADRRTGGFSQGERMKTALARAILHSPQNLLLDEPTNGLDVPSVRSLRGLLRQMRDSGMCIVLSSHILEEVRILCDHVAIVSAGRVVAQGSPEDLCRRTDTESLEDAFIKLTQENLECLATL